MTNPLIAVDVGNDSIKIVSKELDSKCMIPRYKTHSGYSHPPTDPVCPKPIAAEIQSEGLHQWPITAEIGNKPLDDYMTSVVFPDDPVEEYLKVLLTAVAFESVERSSMYDETIEARYSLAFGVPIEGTLGQELSERLLNRKHVVRLKSPCVKTVILQFDEAMPFIKAHAAIADLLISDDWQEQNHFLQNRDMVIHDIGASSSNIALVGARGKMTSEGTADYGVLHVLERVRIALNKEPDRNFTMDELLQIIRDRKPCQMPKDDRLQFAWRIIDQYLRQFASEQFYRFAAFFDQNPRTDVGYMISGGSALIQPYIQEINNNLYPVRFPFPDDAIFLNVKGCFKLLALKLQMIGVTA